MNVSGLFRLLVLVSVVLSARFGFAEEKSLAGRAWNAEVSITHGSWPHLGDVVPAGRGGDFETKGTGFDMKADMSVAQLGDATMFAGFEVGLVGFNSDVIFDDNESKAESAMELSYFTGALTFRLGDRGRQYFDFDVGLGVYHAENKYIDCIAIPSCFEAKTGVTEFGGFVGVSGAIWKGLTLGAKVHLADFGTIESIGPESGKVEGPIYAAYVGWEFGNWRR